MSLRKSTTVDNAHATFENARAGWVWKVLKVNQPSKSPTDSGAYATWFVAAKSPHTFGSWEMGDTYAVEVLQHGTAVHMSTEFAEYLAKHVS